MVIPPNIPLKKIKNLLDCFLKNFFCFITNGNNKKILRIFLKNACSTAGTTLDKNFISAASTENNKQEKIKRVTGYILLINTS